MADDQEKTEDPTPHKLQDARKKGQVAMSKEFATFVVFFGLCLIMYFSASYMYEGVVGVFKNTYSFEQGLISTPNEFRDFLGAMLKTVLQLVAPLFVAVFFFGIVAYVAQFGILFTTEKLKFKLDKISPISGLKKIFSRDTAMEFVKSISKVVGLGIILYFVFKGEVNNFLEIGMTPVNVIWIYFMKVIGKLALAVLGFLMFLGLLDFAYQKWSFFEKQKMSMKEVKDEHKNREGDPHVRARIRQIQRDQARSRMMEEVPDADVVVANPTHVAVAIKYARGDMPAPKVVAKGAGHIALKIKELAIKNEVPVLERREMARFLFRNVEVGHFVPESLYSAVAEVLAYVYRMKKKWEALTGRRSRRSMAF